ncbi:hypothetical protein CLV46_3115 [Diaminobutyricimonas aerilata]|uniref:DUF4383 domain-containing protein n=1 Tax=Diaminobutyricimonas aerilata TaxID=1162967 RepID=A0A2M9CNR4_9MICO|nr:hypothetical protein [Diaminobutyricimonas aerilata]PJJ73522.1 hypothetical protein CLV46_3115 [Diaminobutyricimonas aerilata]
MASASLVRDRVGRLQIVALVGTVVIAAGVGIWAYVLPREFYDHFPSVLGEWISQDGPFNEHLIRDHGAQYLALGAASVGALIWRAQPLYRVLGIAWGGFGVLHFAYHVTHIGHMSAPDATAQMIVLAVAGTLGIGIAIPPRHRESALQSSDAGSPPNSNATRRWM